MKLTTAAALKAMQVKNPSNMPIAIASQFSGENHKILKHDPAKQIFIFDSKLNARQVRHTHFYLDRAITEYNGFDLEG